MSSGGEERRRVEGGCGRINEVTETVARPVIGGPWWSDYSILPMQRFPVVSPTVTLSSPNSKLRYPVPSGLHAPTASPAATLFPSPSRSTLPLPLPSILPLEHSPVASPKHSPPGALSRCLSQAFSPLQFGVKTNLHGLGRQELQRQQDLLAVAEVRKAIYKVWPAPDLKRPNL